jgi:hypothetical protein
MTPPTPAPLDRSAPSPRPGNAGLTPPTPVPLDGKTFAIGVLAVTATILFVAFILLAQTPAQAIGMNDHAGDYKMLTQQVSSTKELLVVVDAAARKAVIYDFDLMNKKLDIASTIPLDQLPKPSAPEERTDHPRRRTP